jgi:NitT/TauT family transport system permease protein
MWEAVCRIYHVPDYLFPAPSSIAASSFRENLPLLLSSLRSTALIAIEAFLLAVIVVTLASFLFVQSRFAEIGIFPYVVLLQVTPIVAIAPPIIILVKSTKLSLIICATLVALFPIISNTTASQISSRLFC